MKYFMLSFLFCSLGLLGESVAPVGTQPARPHGRGIEAPWRTAHRHSYTDKDIERFDFIRDAVAQLATQEEFNDGVHRWGVNALQELFADVNNAKKTSAPRIVGEGLLPEARMRQIVQSSAQLSRNLSDIANRFDRGSKDPKTVAFFELQTHLRNLGNQAIKKAHLLEGKKK